MSRPKVVDTFMFSNELDMLTCRLVELADAVDHFVLVEAEIDHQGNPKPLTFAEHRDLYQPWLDKITHVVVRADQLPSAADNPDPWSREHGQREHIAIGLAGLDLDDHDVILQSDVDEIPRPLLARNVRPPGMWVFHMRFHPFAVDWRHPEWWQGTVAATVGTLGKLDGPKFSYMRESRFRAPCPPHLRDAGWHFSWVGGRELARDKLARFAHPEIKSYATDMLERDAFMRDGIHVDGAKLDPVEIDDTWPRWIREGKAPADWYRPR